MNTLSILSIPLNSALLSPSSSRNKILVCFSRSGFHQPQSLHKQTQIPIRFRLSFSSPVPNFSAVTENQLLDADEDDDDEEDEDDEAAEEYDHDPVLDAAEEHEQSEDEEFETFSDELSTAFQSPETKFQRVQKLCNEVREFGEDIIDADELASLYDFRIDKFQRLAIKAFLRGSSVVVSAPTSSGKTLIAESAAAATIAKGRRLFYTTPLKALSNQKFREFRQTFGDGNVGLLTGDSAVNKDAQVLIMTTEILRNMLYQSVGIISSGSGLFDVDAIVLDEVHYLSDISRGTVWEEIVIYCPKEVQLICLSATVANPDELAGWIGQIHGTTELVTSTRRPVPLTWHFSTKTSLFPLLDENGKTMNRNLSLNNLQLYSLGGNSSKDVGLKRRSTKRRQSDEIYDDIYSEYGMMSGRSTLSKNDMNLMRRSQVPQIGDTLLHLRGRDMLPAIWFIFSRKGCDAAVQYVEDSKLLDDCETSEVELALKRFRIQYPDAVRESAVKALLHGVAAHHAGCLPLWKSFIEDLFQQGLVKVVFATETLAAGINMPARTAVISSLSKRGESGRVQLRSSELLQMAGRAGRRGIDEKGHVVLIQSPYEGAEECCKLLFAGVEPLVSQFTASYGMVLNLLAGSKVTRKTNEEQGIKVSGRTLEEAKKLVEKSFGNYLGSSVMIASKEELDRIQKEIAKLTSEISDDAIDKKSRMLLSATSYKEMAALQEALRIEKRIRSELRRSMELERMSSIIPLMKELGDGNLPFICLNYKDMDGVEHLVPAVYLAKIDALDGSKIKNAVLSNESFRLNIPELKTTDDSATPDFVPSYHVALGSDNSWYIFTEKWIRTVYKTGFPNVSLNKNDPLPEEIMRMLLDKEEMKWENLANSELGGLWHIDGSLETWSWSLNVPMLSSLSEEDEVQELSQAYFDAVDRYKDQRNKVSRLKKKIARTEGFREYKKIVDMAKFSEEKIRRLKTKSNRLINRIKQIEPSGWKEFLQVSTVIHETRALDINTNLIFPLGETASAIRGENELWLAMVLRNKVLVNLKPPQLAAVCGSLVCEGIKIRPSKNNSRNWRRNNSETGSKI